MQFSQPGEGIVTDKTQAESKRVTALRNQVTVLEGETIRLRDLINGEKYEVGQLVKQKEELLNQIPELQTKVDSLLKEIGSSQASLDSMKKEYSEANDRVISLRAEVEVINRDNEEAKSGIETEKENLRLAKAALVLQAKRVADKDTELEEKLKSLRNIIL